MKKNLSNTSAALMAVGGVLLVVSIFLPWWGMKFYAPQYQEGLDIIVYPTTLDGDIDIVNGLNHYIGMAEFSNASFPELVFMPYIIGGFAVLVLIGAVLRNKKALAGLIGLYVALGALGIWDMYRWLKKFGTDLDPKAPIELEPFVPPLIGENTIANFVTNSAFSYGAYLLAVVFLLLVIPLWKDRKL
ncbi:hypothetical protein ACGTN9_11850 [Halobacillus sp. MO56]